tara:strand:- start:135 stop:671 length:537 start_codon:yes stop_codon:yes gene_type:complete
MRILPIPAAGVKTPEIFGIDLRSNSIHNADSASILAEAAYPGSRSPVTVTLTLLLTVDPTSVTLKYPFSLFSFDGPLPAEGRKKVLSNHNDGEKLIASFKHAIPISIDTEFMKPKNPLEKEYTSLYLKESPYRKPVNAFERLTMRVLIPDMINGHVHRLIFASHFTDRRLDPSGPPGN